MWRGKAREDVPYVRDSLLRCTLGVRYISQGQVRRSVLYD
eukprot:COSAG02_NODE_22145_length_762_cov_0.693816_1_plen_39_part_10